ncbi:MAG: hypothetical protein HQK51_12550 [Oligoflexia bacterium]|nr:hypothetical protein [Oligoflexia bacterium]
MKKFINVHSHCIQDLSPFINKCQNITKNLFDDHLRTYTEITILNSVNKNINKNLKTQMSFIVLPSSEINMIFKVIYNKKEIEKQFIDSLCEKLPSKMPTTNLGIDNFMKEYCSLSSGKIKETLEKKIHPNKQTLQSIKELETRFKNNSSIIPNNQKTFEFFWKLHSNVLEITCALEVKTHQSLDVNTLNAVAYDQNSNSNNNENTDNKNKLVA